jgi:hypothetical protein
LQRHAVFHAARGQAFFVQRFQHLNDVAHGGGCAVDWRSTCPAVSIWTLATLSSRRPTSLMSSGGNGWAATASTGAYSRRRMPAHLRLYLM